VKTAGREIFSRAIKIIARHKNWVSGCTITEMIDDSKSTNNDSFRLFTATINGWRSFKIYRGFASQINVKKIIAMVREIKTRIENGDEAVFCEDTMIKVEPASIADPRD